MELKTRVIIYITKDFEIVPKEQADFAKIINPDGTVVFKVMKKGK